MINVRRAKETDAEAIKDLCVKFNKRLPTELGFTLVATEENGEIVGFANVVPKLFIDPLVVNEEKQPVEKVKIFDAMGHFIRGYVSTTNSPNVYFTASNEEFISFLEKRFFAEEFTEEKTYKIKV